MKDASIFTGSKEDDAEILDYEFYQIIFEWFVNALENLFY